MNLITTASATVALITAISGSVWVGVQELRAIEQRADARFVPLSEWQDFQWTQIRRDLRDIEREMAEAEDAELYELAERLEEEYEDLLEFLCRKYPEDREC